MLINVDPTSQDQTSVTPGWGGASGSSPQQANIGSPSVSTSQTANYPPTPMPPSAPATVPVQSVLAQQPGTGPVPTFLASPVMPWVTGAGIGFLFGFLMGLD